MRNQLCLVLLLAAASCKKTDNTPEPGIVCSDCITVSGQVTTPPNGAPVADVFIRAARGTGLNALELAATYTDNAGRYSFVIDRSYLQGVGLPVELTASKNGFLINDYNTNQVDYLSTPTGNSIQKNFLVYQQAFINVHLTSPALPSGAFIMQRRSFGATLPMPPIQLQAYIRADRAVDTTFSVVTAGGVPTYLEFSGNTTRRDTITVAPGATAQLTVNL
ncbi:MAG: hypothetical protein EOO16_08615 [Chitinophagaceae bacterium]|nr:MAG: hypothetical protein EOO16_08615 [Chitinophagaceae bacterium]